MRSTMKFKTTLLTCTLAALAALAAPQAFADTKAELTAETSPVKIQLEAPSVQVETNTPANQLRTQAGELRPDSSWSDKSAANKQPAETNPIYQLTPAQLSSMVVVDNDGDTVGIVTDIVRNMSAAEYKAVISSGGVLGFGAKIVAVPLEALTIANSAVKLNSSAKIIKQSAEFHGEGYISLPDDLPLSEFTAIDSLPTEPTAAGGTS
ncbi:PRC-barrel domain-containing protein [Pontibacter sp. JAM-7]|uniref:PRC-barrel domain-containing protein n=1 Tax=Pontibacter sp. JAM-7 TaxID=3366581 RepID=UPI003AF60B81